MRKDTFYRVSRIEKGGVILKKMVFVTVLILLLIKTDRELVLSIKKTVEEFIEFLTLQKLKKDGTYCLTYFQSTENL